MNRPARRQPGSASPIALKPFVEPIKTPAASSEVALTEPVVADAAGEVSPASPLSPLDPPASAAPAPAVVQPAPEPQRPAPAAKVTRTYKLDLDLVQRAETAVLRAGVHRSMTALVSEAVERELARLAEECNDGVPYPPNADQFRTGRPIGS